MLLAPLTWITGSSSVELLPLTTILQVGVLGPIATLAIYDIGARLAGRLAGLWCAAAFVVAPFAAIPLFIQRYHDSWVDQFLPQALGLTQQADFPSVVAVLGSRRTDRAGVRGGCPAGSGAGGHLRRRRSRVEAGERAVPRRAAARPPSRPPIRPPRFCSSSHWARPSSPSRSGSRRASEKCPCSRRERSQARGRARGPDHGVSNELVRSHRPSELRHLEAEHVQSSRVHVERATRPVPPARGHRRRRATFHARGGAFPHVAARVRGREGRGVRRHDRVRQLLAPRSCPLCRRSRS